MSDETRFGPGYKGKIVIEGRGLSFDGNFAFIYRDQGRRSGPTTLNGESWFEPLKGLANAFSAGVGAVLGKSERRDQGRRP